MPQFGDIACQVVTNDIFTFAIDRVYNNLVKIDYTGDIVDSYQFTEAADFNSTSLHLDSNENIVVHDISGNKINIFNPNTVTPISSVTLESAAGSNLILDLSGNYIVGDWFSAAIDNENFLYTIETPLSADYTTIGFTTGNSFNGVDSVYDQITSIVSDNMCFRYNLSSLSGSNQVEYLSAFERVPLTFTNNNYEEIQFSKLYANNFTNGVISKTFNPQALTITKENKIIIINDSREILELEANNNKPVRFLSHIGLLDSDISTGLNVFKLSDIGLDETLYSEFVTSTYWNNLSADRLNTVNLNCTYEFNDTTSQFETFYWIVDSNNKAVYKTDNNYVLRECFSLPDAIDALGYTGETFSSYKFTKPPATTYDWNRKYNWIANGKRDSSFKATVYTLSGSAPLKHTLQYSENLVDDQFYHLALVYDKDDSKLNFYVDNVLVDQKAVPGNYPIYYPYKTGGIIGTNVLRSNSINNELKCNIYSFHGAFYDVRMYATALTQSQLAQVMLSNLKIQPVDWNIPIGVRQYIEQIERFFMNRHPGHASTLYKIRLVGLNITDYTLRADIEAIIKNTIDKVAPAYTSLYEIEWI